MFAKLTIIAAAVLATLTSAYPLFKQCDSRWSNDQLGTSSKTIC